MTQAMKPNSQDPAGYFVIVQNSLIQAKRLITTLQNIEEKLQQTPRKKTRLSERNPQPMHLQLIGEARNEVESFMDKMFQVKTYSQEMFDELSNPRRSLRNRPIQIKHENVEEDFLDEIQTQAPSKTRSSRMHKQKTTISAKRNRSRGDYVTVSPEVRLVLYQILYEQAQIYYDISYNPYISAELKSELEREFLPNQANTSLCVTDPFLSPNTTTQPSVKESIKSHDSFECSQFSKPIQQNYSAIENAYDIQSAYSADVFLNNFSDDEKFNCNSADKRLAFDPSKPAFNIKKEHLSLYPLAGELNLVKPKEQSLSSSVFLEFDEGHRVDKNILFKSEESDDVTSVGGNRVTRIGLKPLGNKINITIPEEEILKFLKDNELNINEENKKSDNEAQLSIFKATSQITGINEKTLKRIASGGPERKKGGGRKRLDSVMEEQLTVFIVALNRLGRPPTRGEVKMLGQLLSNVPGFRASKGWLDKYLNRIKDELKQREPEFREHFKIISYADLKKFQSKKNIVECLISIGASEKIITKFKKSNQEKELGHTKDVISLKEEAMEKDKQRESYEGDDMIKYPAEDQERIFINDGEVLLSGLNLGSPWKNYV